MWPWGHAAVGYLSYLGLERVREREGPDHLPVLAALFGSQLPDLFDKPLAWSAGVLPSGRSLAHSILSVALILSVLWILTDDTRRETVLALGVGWVSHIFADGVHAMAGGRFSELTYAVWPLLPLPEYSSEPSFTAQFQALRLDGMLAFEFVLCAIAIGAWYRRRVSARELVSGGESGSA